MADNRYTVVVMPVSEADGGGYAALVPELHGCMALGDTREEAVTEVAQAILEWIDEAIALGRAVPEPGAVEDESRKGRAAMRKVIEKQNDLIQQLQQSLSEATAALEAHQDREEVEFGWSIDSDLDLLPALSRQKQLSTH